MKKIRIILAAMAALVISGCLDGNVDNWNDDGRIQTIVYINNNFAIECDRSTNMAYLRFGAGNHGGITAYLDSDGKPMHCDNVKR